MNVCCFLVVEKWTPIVLILDHILQVPLRPFGSPIELIQGQDQVPWDMVANISPVLQSSSNK